MKIQSLLHGAHLCLIESDLDNKTRLSFLISKLWNEGLALFHDEHVINIESPGRPSRPNLVNPDKLANRGTGTEYGRIALMHAIAHIEFNAINLAWDAIHRFRDLPVEYYSDWVKVANDETRHFLMVRNYLKERGYDYGDFDAHDGLWHMAERTCHDPLVRMALVPRVLEARGLDVTPQLIEKFQQVNDHDAASILEVIYTEEIDHVKTGSRWFSYLCKQRQLPEQDTFVTLFKAYVGRSIRGNLNYQARLSAGFSKSELSMLSSI